MQQKYLILAGASGTGKTTIRNILVNFNPGLFANVIQHTTRPRRAYESIDTYVFESKTSFEKIKDNLIGKCTINGNTYGSEPLSSFDSRVGIIILNDEGLNDFKAWADAKKDVIYRIVGIFRPAEEAIEVRSSDGRDAEYIRNEYKIYERVDYIFNNDYEEVSPGDVVSNFSLLGEALQKTAQASNSEILFKEWCENGRKNK